MKLHTVAFIVVDNADATHRRQVVLPSAKTCTNDILASVVKDTPLVLVARDQETVSTTDSFPFVGVQITSTTPGSKLWLTVNEDKSGWIPVMITGEWSIDGTRTGVDVSGL